MTEQVPRELDKPEGSLDTARDTTGRKYTNLEEGDNTDGTATSTTYQDNMIIRVLCMNIPMMEWKSGSRYWKRNCNG